MAEADFIIGDSIAAGTAISVGLKRSGSYAIKSSDSKGISEVGASPTKVLGFIKEVGESKLKGKKLILSSGISNGPNDLATVKKELELLKSWNVTVFLLGVSNDTSKSSLSSSSKSLMSTMNDKLDKLAKEFSYTFCGGFKPTTDGIHPDSYSGYYNSNVKPKLDQKETETPTQKQEQLNKPPATTETGTPNVVQPEVPPSPPPPVEPDFPTDKIFKFNVESSNLLINVDTGTFSIKIIDINENIYANEIEQLTEDELSFDEYTEINFEANEEMPEEIIQRASTINSFDYQSNSENTNTNITQTEDDLTPVNLAPGSIEEALYTFIQKKVKSGYKYPKGGTPVYNVTKNDINKLSNICKKYGIPLEWVSNLINHESAGTWNPYIRNGIGATGLIQFMTTINKKHMTYAKADGSSPVDTDALRNMNFSQHLDYVEGFLERGTKNYRTSNKKIKKTYKQSDLFMTIFYPASVGKAGYVFPAGVQSANGGTKTPDDYTRKATASSAPFPGVPMDIVSYTKKYGTSALDNPNVT
jgi:hypothetical protein